MSDNPFQFLSWFLLKCTTQTYLDDNECQDGSNDCSVNATCKNIPGSFECACKPGFTGNGKQCSGMYLFQILDSE